MTSNEESRESYMNALSNLSQEEFDAYQKGINNLMDYKIAYEVLLVPPKGISLIYHVSGSIFGRILSLPTIVIDIIRGRSLTGYGVYDYEGDRE